MKTKYPDWQTILYIASLSSILFVMGYITGTLSTWMRIRFELNAWCAENYSVVKEVVRASIFSHIVHVYVPYMLSAITIYMNFLAGNKSNKTWLVGLIGQVGWSTWIFYTQNWGFVPLNIALWYIYIGNHIKWNKNITSV